MLYAQGRVKRTLVRRLGWLTWLRHTSRNPFRRSRGVHSARSQQVWEVKIARGNNALGGNDLRSIENSRLRDIVKIDLGNPLRMKYATQKASLATLASSPWQG